MSFNLDTNKLKEENQRLRNVNRELEEENKSLREVLDGKNKELASNFEKISTLEQEIAQYKIDYIYSKLGNEKSNANISNYSSRSRDYSPYKSNQNEFSKIE